MVKILIIEDEPLVLRIYQKIFAFEKFDVELAQDGEEGLAKALSFHPDLILLDIMMPKKNGIQTLEELKANPETQKIPIVVLTNLDGEDNAKTILASGATKCLTKSNHEPEQVVEIVKQILATMPAAKKN